MRKFGSRQVIAILLAIFAAVFAYVGIEQLGFMDPVDGPGPGFFPAVMAIVMLVVCVIAFFQTFGETKKVVYTKDELLVIGCGVGIAALAFLIGLIPACVVFILFWMKVLQKDTWRNTVIILAICLGIAFGVFQEWLGIEFPLGIFDEL